MNSEDALFFYAFLDLENQIDCSRGNHVQKPYAFSCIISTSMRHYEIAKSLNLIKKLKQSY